MSLIQQGPLVSVLIPSYNRAHLLPSAIKSVLGQRHDNIEIIIIDDGSTDNTAEIAGCFPPSVRYLRQENKGPSAARNTGIRCARGEIVAFLDSDDMWLPGKLSIQLEMFAQGENIGLVAGGYWLNGVGNRQRTAIVERTRHKNRITFSELMVRNRMTTSSVVVRKDCFSRTGFFDEEIGFGEDWEMWLRIAAHHDIGYVPLPLVEVFFQNDGITKGANPKNFIDWDKVIKRNAVLARGLLPRLIGTRKARSWYFVNKALVSAVVGDRNCERRNLLRSIFQWPFHNEAAYPYGRVAGIAKTFVGKRLLLLIKKVLLNRRNNTRKIER